MRNGIHRSGRALVAVVIIVLVAGVVALLGLLATSIMERRWESQRPLMVAQPIAEWEPNSAVWGRSYPSEYDSYLRGLVTDTRTKFGGSEPRDYLDADPLQVVLFAGYGFSKEYRQARGHNYAITDVTKTQRTAGPNTAATCWTCKSPDVPRIMAQAGGPAAFYAGNFHELKKEITHPIGCADCHNPKDMTLRITRPALREAYAAMGKDIAKATHQEMRSLVCAQCHVEYYFKAEPKNYLAFPWAKGTSVEAMIEYYDAANFTDWTHPVSKTPMLKAQHPDYEMYSTGVHAYRNVSCADCHMPYRTEGGMKFTDHHVQSPLLNIANSCAVCHRWGEQELRARVEAIQTKVADAKHAAEEALVKAHLDVAAAMQAGATEEQLAPARKLLRHAQFRWDYVSANNGMGFHSPQESMRVLGQAAEQAQEVRLQAARMLAAKGISQAPSYPDVASRLKAAEVAKAFVGGKGPKLLP